MLVKDLPHVYPVLISYIPTVSKICSYVPSYFLLFNEEMALWDVRYLICWFSEGGNKCYVLTFFFRLCVQSMRLKRYNLLNIKWLLMCKPANVTFYGLWFVGTCATCSDLESGCCILLNHMLWYANTWELIKEQSDCVGYWAVTCTPVILD